MDKEKIITEETAPIPLSDIIVDRIKYLMKKKNITRKQLCTSDLREYKSITVDQYKAIMSYKSSNKKNRVKSISYSTFVVLYNNLGCSPQYLKGERDKNITFPLEFTNPKTKEEILKNLNKIQKEIKNLYVQEEISNLYFILCEADEITRKEIMNQLSNIINQRKSTNYWQHKWQNSECLQEKQAALSLVYNIGLSVDINEAIESFFDAELYYNHRNYYEAVLRYFKVIIIYLTKGLSLKPYYDDSIYRLLIIIDRFEDFDKEITGLNKLQDNDYYELCKMKETLNKLKPPHSIKENELSVLVKKINEFLSHYEPQG